MLLNACRTLRAAGSAAALLLAAFPVLAQTPAPAPGAGTTQSAAPRQRQTPVAGPEAASAPSPSGLWGSSSLFGDMGGLRTDLGRFGIAIGLQETSEVLGNPTGGVRLGVIYEGVTEMSLGLDTEKAFGWQGGVLNISAFQIHGRGLSINDLDNLNLVSGIEADRSTRLFELWYQQGFLRDRLDIRVGQIAADQEFMITQYGTVFINSSFGWPVLPGVDLPAGGPAYPFAATGVRLRAKPTEQLTLLAGLFNGNPAGPGLGDPQRRDSSGLYFSMSNGAFAIAQAQYAINQGAGANGLPGSYKLGGWYNSNAFTNRFYTLLVLPPTVVPRPLRLAHGDYSFYAVADQLVYRTPGTKDGGIGVFVRAMGAPGDRNLVSFFGQGGATYKGLISSRPNDTAGLGFLYTRIGVAAREEDMDVAAARPGYPVRSAEWVLEITYQVQLAPWWTLQPDFQYVFNPGGGLLNPDKPGQRIGDAAVLGLRTNVIF
jgi:porin